MRKSIAHVSPEGMPETRQWPSDPQQLALPALVTPQVWASPAEMLAHVSPEGMPETCEA